MLINEWLKHLRMQFRLNKFIDAHFPEFEAGPELTCRLRENRYLVPDVAVVRKDRIQDPYPIEPVHVCVEILSPDDRFSEVVAKCEEYLAWGVPMVWIIDPVIRVAWEFGPNRLLHEVPAGGSLTAPEIAIPLADIFSAL